jgi:hypothetical protein
MKQQEDKKTKMEENDAIRQKISEIKKLFRDRGFVDSRSTYNKNKIKYTQTKEGMPTILQIGEDAYLINQTFIKKLKDDFIEDENDKDEILDLSETKDLFKKIEEQLRISEKEAEEEKYKDPRLQEFERRRREEGLKMTQEELSEAITKRSREMLESINQNRPIIQASNISHTHIMTDYDQPMEINEETRKRFQEISTRTEELLKSSGITIIRQNQPPVTFAQSTDIPSSTSAGEERKKRRQPNPNNISNQRGNQLEQQKKREEEKGK